MAIERDAEEIWEINVQVEREGDAFVVATSPDMPDLHLIAPTIESLRLELPWAIEQLYRLNHKRSVKVLPFRSAAPGPAGGWAAVPSAA